MTRFIGLTGSIGMGKSTAVKQLRRLKIPVHDADAVVHRALGKNGAAVDAVKAAFPDIVTDHGIDRQKLGQQVFFDHHALKKLEKILHPIVWAAERKFRLRMIAQRRRIAILDIPLLFETGADRRVDAIIVVTAPPFLQHQRVMRRLGMSEQKFRAILTRQMPDHIKRRKADFVVHTGLGHAYSMRQWRRILGSEKLNNA